MVSSEQKQTDRQRLLAMLLDRPGALESKQRFAGLMMDCFPQERATVNLLSMLYDMGIHTEMAKADLVTRDFAYRFTKRLVDDYDTNRGRAENIVALFCVCYAEVLGKPCDLASADEQGGGGVNEQMPTLENEQTAAPARETETPGKFQEQPQRAQTMDHNAASLAAGLAYSALEEGNLDTAIMLLTRAIDLDGGNAALYELRGTAHSMKKDWRSAIGDFDLAIGLVSSAGAYGSRAYAYQNMNEHDRAIGDFDAAISMAAGDDPKRHFYYSMRGSAHQRKGDLDRAIEDFSRAITIQDLAPFRSQRGQAYEEKGLYDKALADLEQAVRLEPSEQDWRDQRDHVLKRSREVPAQAANAGERLYQLGWESKSKYGQTHEAGDLLEAARLWREAADKGHVKAKLSLADLYSNPSFPDHRPKEAVRLLNEVMECPDSDPCWRSAAIELGLMHCEGRVIPQDLGGWKLISTALEKAKPEDLSATTAFRVALLCSIGVPNGRPAYNPSVDDLAMAVKYFGLAAELAEREGAAEEYKNFAREQRDAHIDLLKSKEEALRRRQEQEQEKKQLQIELGLSKERCVKRRLELARYCNSIAVSGCHTVGLRADGTVVAVGSNDKGLCNTGGWRGIVAIAATVRHTVGLRADGTVVAVGCNEKAYNQVSRSCSTGGWRGIVAIAAGYRHTVGLRADGTVVVTGANEYVHRKIETNEWRGVVAVAVGGEGKIAGLRGDGTVVATGYIQKSELFEKPYDLYSFGSGVVAIAAEDDHIVCLSADGTVEARGYDSNKVGFCDTRSWKGWEDIVAIAACSRHTVGLRADGTVVAVGSNGRGQCNTGDWRDIVAIAAGNSHTVGLRADGTVVAVGWNEYGQCDTGGWRDIVAIATSNCHYTVGLRSDGTVVAVGENKYGQCDTGGWKNIGLLSETKYRMQNGLCLHCGGQLGGFFTKKCKSCGKTQ